LKAIERTEIFLKKLKFEEREKVITKAKQEWEEYETKRTQSFFGKLFKVKFRQFDETKSFDVKEYVMYDEVLTFAEWENSLRRLTKACKVSKQVFVSTYDLQNILIK
jgi:hypothetical protein